MVIMILTEKLALCSRELVRAPDKTDTRTFLEPPRCVSVIPSGAFVEGRGHCCNCLLPVASVVTCSGV